MIKKVFLFAIAISLCAVAAQAQGSPSLDARFFADAWGQTRTSSTSKKNNSTQTTRVNLLEKAIQKARLKAAKSVLKTGAKIGAAAAAKVCKHCGREITEAYQHCDATGCTSLCEAAEQTANQAAQQAPAQQRICAHCGEEITHAYQHCDALNGVGLCETAEQVAERKAADAAYEKRKAEERAEAMKKYPKCVRCGEPVVSPEQECRATHYDYECIPETPAAGSAAESGSRCSECGRTPEGVKVHGHNHK